MFVVSKRRDEFIYLFTYFASTDLVLCLVYIYIYIQYYTACDPRLCFLFFTWVYLSSKPTIKYMKSDYKPWVFINFILISLYVRIYLAIYSNIHYYLTVVEYLLLLGCIETNPGPANHLRLSFLKIVHKNVCS